MFEPNPTGDADWPYLLMVLMEAKFLRKPAITEVLLSYNSEIGQFRFKKGNTTGFQALYKGDVFTVAHLLNSRPDRYAITLEEPLVYHNRQFFKLDYAQAEAKFATYIKGVKALKQVEFEKIPDKITADQKAKLTKWPVNSVFSRTLNLIRTEFGSYDWVFCDDPHREMADFIVADFKQHRIAFIHCKHGKKKSLSVAVFHDLCSQAAKNLVYLRTSRLPAKVHTWTRDSLWESSQIKKWLQRGKSVLPEKGAMWKKLNDEILQYPKSEVDVWLVMGDGLQVSKLKKPKTKKKKKESPELGPLLHLLDGLVANCAEADVRLRIFGH